MRNLILSLLFFVSSIALGQSFIKGNVLYETPTVTTASGVTTAILVTSQPNQVLTGTTTQTYSLPDVQATSPDISPGFTIKFQNNSTGSAFFTYADGSAAATVRAGERADFVLTSNATTNGTWAVKYLDHVKLAGDTMTGPLTVPSLNGITSSIIAYLSGLTANVQTQIDGKVNRAGDTMTGGLGLDYVGVNASTVPYLDSERRFTSSTITPTELGYLTGLTGNVQSQINAGGGGASGVTSYILAKGDLIVGVSSADATRQAIGTNGQVLTADSLQTNGLKWANAPQGLKNYVVTNSDLEQGTTTGFSLGTATLDANKVPSGAPTFGSGASGNLSLTSVSTGVLAGSYSMGYVSSAATTAGNFVATDAFAVDLEGQAKALQFKIAYSVFSNPANGNYSGTNSNSFGVAIYDVTNSAWIAPAGIFNVVQNSGVGIASGTFQTSPNGTSYRIVFYNANATSGATTIYLDDFFVGPQITAAGAAVSDWTSYTPTITNFTNLTVNKSQWRRVGDSMEIYFHAMATGAATGQIEVSLPPGYSIDTNKFQGSGDNYFGGSSAADFTGNTYTGNVIWSSANTVRFHGPNIAATWAASTPMTWAVSDVLSFQATVPIVGWSSQTVMSNDTDTRVVAASYFVVSTAAITNGAGPALIPLTTKIVDTHNAVSGNQFRVPVSGVYRISCTGGTDASTNTGYVAIVARKNAAVIGSGGSVLQSSTSVATTPSVTVIVEAVAGDLLDVVAQYVQGSNRNFSATVSFERLSGPATIAATESVYAYYASSAGQSIANAATPIIDFATKVLDSHNAVTTGASWKFTAPVSGTYAISSNIRYANGGAWTQGGYASGAVYKNGGVYSSTDTAIQTTATLSTGPTAILASPIIKLNAGDYIDVRTSHAESAARSLVPSGSLVWVQIHRVGN